MPKRDGGEVKERRITREVWWKARLCLIENVPVGVCQQCAHKVILPEVAKVIDKLLSSERAPDRFVHVPTYRLPEPEPVP